MNSEMQLMFDIVDERLGKSEVLQRLGYGSRVREFIEETEHLPARCCFHLVTGQYRCFTISCDYKKNDNSMFTFEIFHTMLDESFLLEDWTKPLRDPHAPYAFMLSAYKGDFKEKLNQLIQYVDRLLSQDDEIIRILKGEVWTEFASHL